MQQVFVVGELTKVMNAIMTRVDMFLQRLLAMVLVAICAPTIAVAQEEQEEKITFEDHIKPIFREHCTACHSVADKASDLALDSYGEVLAGGSGGMVVEEGSVLGSRLYALVSHEERPFMPPDEDLLPEEQRNLIKVWIEQGMPENSDSKIKRSNAAASAMVGDVNLGKPDGPPPMPESLLRQAIITTERAAAISAIEASPWAPLVAVGGQAQVSLYHSESGELLGVLPFPEGIPQSLRFTRDGKQLLIGGGEHSVSGCAVLVDIATGERITKVGDELDIVLAADIAPDKSKIAVAGPQKIIRVYDSVTGDKLQQLDKHTDWVFTLRYSPDGILLASGDRSNGLVVWEADSGNVYADLTDHRDAVRSLDFRADSNVLVSGSLDGTIKLWDMFESKAINSWNAHGGGVTSVKFTQDGMIASSGRDARVKLWKPDGNLESQFQGLSEAALQVAVTGDGSAIAGGDWHGQVKLWPTSDPQQAKPIASNPPSIEARMEQAEQQLTAVQAEFDEAEQNTSMVLEQAEKAQEEFAAARQGLASRQQELEATEKQRQELTSTLDSQNMQIDELEQKLAQLKSAREQTTHALQSTSGNIDQLKEQLKAAERRVESAKQRSEKLAKSAEEAANKKAQVESELKAAQQAYEQAVADKQALDQQAEKLTQAAHASSVTADELAQELETVSSSQAEKQQELETLSSEVQSLQQKLEELKSKLSQAEQAKESVEEQLTQSESKVTALQDELDVAQQAAAEAREKLQLFEQAYKKPD